MATVSFLPEFSRIDIKNAGKNLDLILKTNLEKIDGLLQQKQFTWDNLCQPIEDLNDTLHRFWGPIQHLSAVVNAPDLRDTMNACLPKLSDYQTRIAHNEKLFHAIESIKNSIDFEKLSPAKQKSIENDLRDFKLSGVHLPPDKKNRFAELTKSLSQLTHRFEENVLDATMSFKKHITDEKELSGIPEHARQSAKALAERENKSGWLFTLEAPDYLAIMLHADSRTLRESLYRAYVTRASDQSHDKQFDNTALITEIVEKRYELAQLLQYNTYADLSLATKMVKKPDEVISFLTELANKAVPVARKEFKKLATFAKEELHIPALEAWDIAYASEKLRMKAYNISQEDLRPYFPMPHVLSGLFQIIHRLYGVTLVKIDNVDIWHRDVSCYQLQDENHQPVAHLFFDLYARPNKRGGAWMDDCSTRRRLSNGDIQLPAAYVTCNFQAPIGNQPALFTHDDVVTLFHECGHALQHILTKMDVASVSGIHGIPWDAVEVASQFFENWAWDKESLHYIAKHFQTQTDLPQSLYEKMQRAKHFQSAMQMVRQLEFALFDFRLHMEFNKDNVNCVQSILDDVRKSVSVFIPPHFNRFQNSFTHIFGGSYAAGYYSYKWAEVMACDAFSLFEEKGIFDHYTSKHYQHTFLESGGAIDPMDLFITFRGRKPTVDALLNQSGIAS